MYLAHHGIKGQKWGVRRYQNPDGTLTDAGRARYYSSDGRLNSKGLEYNKRADAKFKRYKKDTLRKASQSNPEFDKARKRLNKLKKQDRQFAEEEHRKWLSGEDYKGLDYYQFKDKRSGKFSKSDAGKEIAKTEAQLRSILDNAAKKDSLYGKSYTRLSDALDDYETIDYGKSVVNQLMVQLKYEYLND